MTIIKKLLAGLTALCLVVVLGCGGYYLLNREELTAEYEDYCRSGAPVLMYHGIENPDNHPDWPQTLLLKPELFEAQLAYLTSQGYKLVTLAELSDRLYREQSVEKYAAITFDDGYKNNYEIALPILQRYNAKATFFCINKDVGTKFHMTNEEMLALIDAGMEIGSHTISHNPLARIDEKYLTWELATSRYFFKKSLNEYVVRSLAYPNGNYNAKVIKMAARYGFYQAVTGHIGLNNSEDYLHRPMEMYRVTVADDGNGVEGLKKRLWQAGFYGFLAKKGLDINKLRDLFIQ